jgi:hypothetical protein
VIYDRATTALVHGFLLGGVAIGEAGVVLVVFIVLLQGVDHCSGTFFFIILLTLLAGCIRNAIKALRCFFSKWG